MTPLNDDQIIDAIIRREGGYVNAAGDRGGPTKYGITQATLAEWRGKDVTAADVEALTEIEARDILEAKYVIPFALAPLEVRGLLVDCAVNHGVTNATKLLQRGLGVLADGIFGEKTKAALQERPWRITYANLAAERIRFYGRIISHDPSQAKFAAGWLDRAAEFVESLA